MWTGPRRPGNVAAIPRLHPHRTALLGSSIQGTDRSCTRLVEGRRTSAVEVPRLEVCARPWGSTKFSGDVLISRGRAARARVRRALMALTLAGSVVLTACTGGGSADVRVTSNVTA